MKKKSKLKNSLAIIFICLLFVVAFNVYYKYIRAAASPVVQFTADVIVSLSGISDGSLYIRSGSEAGSVDIAGSSLTVTAIPDGNTFTLKTPDRNNSLKLTPSGGALNLAVDSSKVTSNAITEWTVTGSGNTGISYTVGVPEASTWYAVRINSTLYNSYLSNAAGEITFSYNGDWLSATKVFTVAVNRAMNTGGGATLPPTGYAPPISPEPSPSNLEGEFKVIILEKEPTPEEMQGGITSLETTDNREIILKLFAGPDTETMAVSEDPEFIGINIEPFAETKTWILSEGDGLKTIYVKFFNKQGVSSKIISININLRTKEPIPPEVIIPEVPVFEEAPEVPVYRLGVEIAKVILKGVRGDNEIYSGLPGTIYGELAEKIAQVAKRITKVIKSAAIKAFDIIISDISKIVPDFIQDKLFEPRELKLKVKKAQPEICNAEFYKGLRGTLAGCLAERTVQVAKRASKNTCAKAINIFDYAISDISKIVPDSLEDKLFNSTRKNNNLWGKMKKVFKDSFSL